MPTTLRSRMLTGVLILALLWFGASALIAIMRAREVQHQLDVLNDQVQAAQHESGQLGTEIQHLQNPARLALLARQRLNYKLPDETVAFVYKSEKSGTIAQPIPSATPVPNWRLWWDWLLRD